jgi:hypothetical protein
MFESVKPYQGSSIIDIEVVEPTATAESAPEPKAEPEKRKRGRPPKKKPEEQTASAVALPTTQTISIPAEAPKAQPYVPLCTSNEPYEMTYAEGVGMIRGTIQQMDTMAIELKNEFDAIRNNKQMKGRYTYISNLGESICGILGNKLTAIKELNAVTTKSHELEMKRYQATKELQMAEDDDRSMAAMYNAYINTPINTGNLPPFLQQTSQNTIANPGMMGSGTMITPSGDIVDAGYGSYMQTISPEQNRMILEHNPNIKEVVVLDDSTGAASFDVIDTTTGQSVPNYPRPNPELIAETIIDRSTGRATNSNLGKSWDVITINGGAISKF